METKQIIINAFAINNIPITEAQADKLNKYYTLLIKYNNMYNLTNITNIYEAASKHFVDSVFGGALIKNKARVLDIGCGAGFPSIPLAIMRPDISFVLIDSVGKKINFVNTVIKELELNNCTAYHTRAQEFCTKQNREAFDYVIARALAPLNILLELCIPFVKLQGSMLAYKSQNYSNEISEAQNAFYKLFAKMHSTKSYQLIHMDKQNNREVFLRYIIDIKKTKSTPTTYPRLKNLIKTNPL